MGKKSASTRAAISKIQKNADKVEKLENVSRLGRVVMYDTTGEKVETAKLAEAWRAAKVLPLAWLPPEPSHRKIFGECIRRGTNGLKHIDLNELESNIAGVEVFAFQEVKSTGDKLNNVRADYGEPLARVYYFNADASGLGTPVVQVDTNYAPAIAVRDDWQSRTGSWSSSDVSLLIKTALSQCSYIRMKKSGHAYFVSEVHAARLEALKALVEKLGIAEMSLLKVFSFEEDARDIVRNAGSSIAADIDQLAKRAEKFKSSSHKKTMKAALEEAKGLQEQAQLFKDLVGLQTEDLDKALASITKKVDELLGVD